MNYRHAYHAGNFADVLKHIVLVLCLDYLQRKAGPLCIVDAHGGAGLYDLDSEEAVKTGEAERGIGALAGRTDAPPDLRLYLDPVKRGLEARQYPGSPLLISRSLRPQDRLITSELHTPSFESLEAVLKPYKNARAMNMDAYECIRAHIPPKERRGLVLIDPPFERKDEFEILARQMKEWKKRWETGVYLLWYPIKAHLPVDALKEAARALALPRTWCAEILIQPRNQAETLNGCGLIVFNAPYTVPERAGALLPYLKEAMNLHETASAWVVPPL
ncbi:MAG: 23S rRNA (adenine(2030)-N(6))-methyltransferase RlmJ [Rhodomicrobium sp.]|nr:23S rRNA (adenine(2030)-N(6))-methyltransferase RlmJ [Rhodomicrobium sp.]